MFAMSLPEDDFQVEELRNLLEHALQNTYKSRENDPKGGSIMFNCLRLFGKDYQYSVVSNTNGELCNHYPSKVVVLEYVLAQCEDSSKHRVQSLYNVDELKELFSKARFARCRARFSIPVILFEGKHICRSATISGGAEIYGRSGIDFFFTGGESIPGGSTNNDESSEWQLFNRIRGQDIRLLKQFSVGMICDLMVEKKKVKFGMNVTSSEKVDKENRYAEFSIMSVPYPGCEFFREWRQNGYMAEGMMFDWEQGYVDADLDLPDQMNSLSSIDWTKYRTWDLVKLTQNYLRLLLHYVKKGDSGLLIHCISGWDRTPLFISLLRLSLWADGSIHTSLSPLEILYLTIAYDWFLFGHNLPDRIGKGEEIFFFCFNFLKYITTEEFSVTPSAKAKTVSRTNSECNMADDVLLGTHIHQAASSTSINSSSSANSTKSSIDNPPTCFSTDMPDDEPITPHGPPVSIPSCTSRLAPVTKVQADKCASSPMAVPCNRWREPKPNSPAYGSWQIISGTGSFRGSTSSYDSPRSSASEHSFAGNGCYTQHDPHEETPRKQRLDAVRRLFLSVYCSGTGCRTFPEANGANSGISGLLENFAEKVGFRGSGSTIV